MKQLLPLILLIAHILPIMAGDGSSAQSPLTVTQALARKNDHKSYYVSGYIVGEYRDYSNNKHFYYLAPPFDGTSAYLIADDVDEIDLNRMMPVQIKDYVDNYNLDENPQYWHKRLTVKGTLTDYFTLPGIKNLTDWIAPAEPLDDEARYWNFYETFETKKAYTPDGSQMYSGGTYASAETCLWKFVGATYGNSSNDMKWDNAAAHLRLTESTSGEPGYICMLADKTDGIGYLRLWAARYKEDKGSASFGIFLSNDQGKSWEAIQTDVAIEKELTEYQFKIMRPGTWRTYSFLQVKMPNPGPPKFIALPSVCPSATAKSAPYCPGVCKMPSASGLATDTSKAPAPCTSALMSSSGSSWPKKFGPATAKQDTCGVNFSLSAFKSTVPFCKGTSSSCRPGTCFK